MEIKQGSSAVPLFIKPRVAGVVITVTAWEALYGGTTGVYTLIAESYDKTDTQTIVGTDQANGIDFILPAAMFLVAQRVYKVTMKFVINGITDFSLYNFEVKVTKPDSPESR